MTLEFWYPRSGVAKCRACLRARDASVKREWRSHRPGADKRTWKDRVIRAHRRALAAKRKAA